MIGISSCNSLSCIPSLFNLSGHEMYEGGQIMDKPWIHFIRKTIWPASSLAGSLQLIHQSFIHTIFAGLSPRVYSVVLIDLFHGAQCLLWSIVSRLQGHSQSLRVGFIHSFIADFTINH